MLREYLHGRVLLCIDAANLESAVKDLEWHIDYRHVMGLVPASARCGARFYSVRHGTTNHDGFLTVLKRMGFTLITKPLKLIKELEAVGGYLRKANFDVEIAVDALDAIASYDTLVLFSGDSDFAYLIRYLRAHGKRVVVISTRYHVSREVIEAAHKYIDLRDLRPWIDRK